MKRFLTLLLVALTGIAAGHNISAQSSMLGNEAVVQPGKHGNNTNKRPVLNNHASEAATSEPQNPQPSTTTTSGYRTPGENDSTSPTVTPSPAVMNEYSDIIRGSDFSFYLKQAEAGDTEAQRRAGICYLYGTGVDRDLKKGKEWIAKAALNENTEAQYDLGVIFRDGYGVKVNLEEAAYWFRKAARNGNANAQLNVGLLFLEGRGVQQDTRVAAENFWRAAEQGNVDAAYRVACMYRDGIGMAKDLSKAYHYFTVAASKGEYKDAAIQAEALKEHARKKSNSTRKRRR